MEKGRGIGIIGSSGIGIAKALELANKGDLPIGMDNYFTEPKEEVIIITRLPELPEIWIDPKEPVFNEHKHKQTCVKNRKKRKKRKRR